MLIVTKMVKISAILLAMVLMVLIIVNAVYWIYDGRGYGWHDEVNLEYGNALNYSLEKYNESLGIDMSVPCVDGPVEIVTPRDFEVTHHFPIFNFRDGFYANFQRYVGRHFVSLQNTVRIKAGSALTVDEGMFANAPCAEAGVRKVNLGLGSGGGQQTFIRLNDLSELYYDYLTDNNMAARFEQETGTRLTRSNATKALLGADKQMFERNIANSPDYKYSPLYLLADTVCFFAAAILALFCAVSLIIWWVLKQREKRNSFLTRPSISSEDE